MASGVFPVRFEWERKATANEWVNLIRGLPASSPVWAHDNCPPNCTDRQGRPRLRPATIKQIAITLATYARPDGSDAHPGVDVLAIATGRDRTSVMSGLAHLEAAGLLLAQSRAGKPGVPRWHATSYHLSTPSAEHLLRIGPALADEGTRLDDWFTPPPERKHPESSAG